MATKAEAIKIELRSVASKLAGLPRGTENAELLEDRYDELTDAAISLGSATWADYCLLYGLDYEHDSRDVRAGTASATLYGETKEV